MSQLDKKIEAGMVEVEDIIQLAKEGDSKDAAKLLAAKEKYNWREIGYENADGSIIPPIGAWANIAVIFLQKGYDGFKEQLDNEKSTSYIISFLEEMKSSSSIELLILIFKKYSHKDEKDIRIKAAKAVNLLMSFGPVPEISNSEEAELRDGLHYLLAECSSEDEYATVVCALRGVGDVSSLDLLKSIPKLTGAWEGTENVVKKAIKKRITNGSK